MVQLTLTPHLSHAIGVYNALPNIGPPLPTRGHLSHQQIHELSRALLAAHPHKRQRYSFARLLQGTEIFHAPAPAPAPKTAEYVALMARLRAEAEAASYAALVASPAKAEEDEAAAWAAIKPQLSAVFNVLLSVFATAAAVWKVAAHWDVAARLAAAFAAAVLVAVAEVVLFSGYLRRMEEAGRRERGKGEMKAPTGVRWVVGGEGVVGEKVD